MLRFSRLPILGADGLFHRFIKGNDGEFAAKTIIFSQILMWKWNMNFLNEIKLKFRVAARLFMLARLNYC